MFYSVVRLPTIRVVAAMCVALYLHLEHLDAKSVFLHGELENEIYIL